MKKLIIVIVGILFAGQALCETLEQEATRVCSEYPHADNLTQEGLL